jgi:hypothetical protein
MKQIVLVAFLIATGCTRQLDCDAAVDQGIKRLTSGFRAYAPDPQTLASGTRTLEQIEGTLVRRCTVDRWPSEVTQCFASMNSGTDLQTCQSKLSPDSSSRLSTEIAEATRRRVDPVAVCKPPDAGDRRARARTDQREAMDVMIAYRVALCACNDHDMNCGKAATDDYQRAMAEWAATRTGEIGMNTKPDPEMEKLVTEIVDCSKRVMTPAMGPAGRTPSP